MLPRGLFLAALCSYALGAIYDSLDDLSTLTYDFIIVGGGTAGNVIANRLTEDANVTVLILEAGGSNAGVIATPPLLAPALAPYTQYDWNYTTTGQTGLGGRTIPYPRGFVLGGSSSINYMVYTRGSTDDFGRYANLTGDPGLSWANIQPYIRRNEDFIAPSDHGSQHKAAVASTDGVVSVSLYEYPWPQDSSVMATTQEDAFSDEFPYNEDMNSGNPIGLGWAQATIGQGQRSSSATAYLGAAYIARPNLDVLLHARATRILQTGARDDSYPIFQSVEFTTGTNASAPRATANARREIVLSAGSFNSPQLLMLSGVGDPAELAPLGIEPLVTNLGVGKNMSDHVLLANAWSTQTNESYETYLRDPAVLMEQEAAWNETGTGPLSYTITDQIGWFRLPNTSVAFNGTADPSAGPTSGHYELIFSNGFAVPGQQMPSTGNFFSIFTNVVSPSSRGTVALRSSNPFDEPVIDPNLLGTPLDVSVIVAALRAAQRFVTSDSMCALGLAPVGALADVYNGTDAQLAAYARANAGAVWHAVGTAGMGPPGDTTWGAVDPLFRVKGMLGVRVVDASVIPIVPSAHTQAPVYIFAERAADLIKETWASISSIDEYAL